MFRNIFSGHHPDKCTEVSIPFCWVEGFRQGPFQDVERFGKVRREIVGQHQYDPLNPFFQFPRLEAFVDGTLESGSIEGGTGALKAVCELCDGVLVEKLILQ